MSESHSSNRPIISVTVTPSFIHEWESLQSALGVLSQQDRDVTVMAEPAKQRIIISGIDESHLEGICNRLAREFKIQVEVGKPQVLYLETIRKCSEAEGKYIRQIGGRGQYAHVRLAARGASLDSRAERVEVSTGLVC